MSFRRTQRRICGLCGQLFAIMIPEGVEETERDKLCSVCQQLPARRVGRRGRSYGFGLLVPGKGDLQPADLQVDRRDERTEFVIPLLVTGGPQLILGSAQVVNDFGEAKNLRNGLLAHDLSPVDCVLIVF
jgi:hypothetical protein